MTEGHINAHAAAKRARAQRWARLLLFIPFSHTYLLTGSVAQGSAHAEGDIDLVVVAQKNYVWLHRAILFIVLFLTGMRRTTKNRRNKFCIAASFACGASWSTSLSLPLQSLARRAHTNALERILIASGVAWLGEQIARRSIGWYVTSRLAHIAAHPDTVLDLGAHHIVYFPPRASRLDTQACERKYLDALSSTAPLRG